MCSITNIKKIINFQKKIMDGRFNRFLFSLNAVLCTPQKLHTHHYVGVDDLSCHSLNPKSYYTYHSNRDAAMYGMMCYMTSLMTKCLIIDITAIWALTSMCAVLSCDPVNSKT